jgi:two-component system LytT family sensor kinase
MIADETEILAVAGEGSDAFRIGEPLPTWLVPRREEGLLVKRRLTEQAKGLPFGSAVVAPPVVRGSRVGSLVVLYRSDQRLQPDDTRVVSETGALVAAELELAEIEAQNQSLALAELRALRAQISPHFIYNALAAVAALIRTNPDKAPELLAEFAHFIRYAFRGQQPAVRMTVSKFHAGVRAS